MNESGLHRHEHEHPGSLPHRHVHHHSPAAGPHDHRHATGFERFSYLVSPVHALDARTKVLAALVFVLLMRQIGYVSPNLYVPFANVTITMPEWLYFVFAAFVHFHAPQLYRDAGVDGFFGVLCAVS